MKDFAERLRELRLEMGLSYRGLAKHIGFTSTAIEHWEKEDRIPNAEAVVALAKFFSVSTDYLLGLTD